MLAHATRFTGNKRKRLVVTESFRDEQFVYYRHSANFCFYLFRGGHLFSPAKTANKHTKRRSGCLFIEEAMNIGGISQFRRVSSGPDAILVYQNHVNPNPMDCRVLKWGCSRGGGNWGTLRIPREDWGTLRNIRED